MRYPADVLPLHVAEMDFEVDPGVRAVLAEMVAKSDLGYLGPIPEVPAAFVGFAERHWGWTPDANQIRLTTDVGVGVVEREPKGKNNAFFWAYSGQTKYYDTGNLAATKIPDKISNHA